MIRHPNHPIFWCQEVGTLLARQLLLESPGEKKTGGFRRMSEGFGTVQDVSKLLKNATGRSSIPLCLGFWIILGMAERWHGMIMNDPKSIARFLGRSSASMRGLYRWSSTLTYRSNGDGLWPQMAGLPTSTNILKHPKTSLLGAENPPF